MTGSCEIIPAIIPKSFEDIYDKASLIKDLVEWVQVDVIDGVFAPSASWPYAPGDIASFQEMTDQKKQLPFLDKLNYEIDLMVENPEDYVGIYEVAPGIDLIISDKDGILMLQAPGQNPIGIDAYSDGTYAIPLAGAVIEFKRTVADGIVSLVMTQGTNVTKAVKK